MSKHRRLHPFEHKHEPIIPVGAFVRRVVKFLSISLLMIAGSLSLGVWGYSTFAGLEFIDALYNASMILPGMGPIDPMTTKAAKIWASVYALYSGVTFLPTIAVFLAPAVHRGLHILHAECVTE